MGGGGFGRTMKLLTRRVALVEEQGQTYMADNGGESDEARVLRPPQAAACTYRIAVWPACRAKGADAAGCNAQAVVASPRVSKVGFLVSHFMA